MTEHITVIIPTRDRADVLQHTLAATLSLQDRHMTVLVSDNCSVDETPELLKRFDDHRLSVIRTPARVSMRANWEYALKHVKDGWVTVIGDDDAVLPGAFETVRRISAETGIEAVRSSTAEFIWPKDGQRASLTLPLARGYEVKDTHHELAKVMAGKKHYTKLPVLYNGGFVKVSALRRMALRDGTVFGGSIPDVYTGIALCSVLQKYVYCKEALAINGASRHSGGTAAMQPKGQTATSDQNPFKKFLSENDVPFHSLIPSPADFHVAPATHIFVLETFLTAQDAGIMLPVSIDFREQYELIMAELAERGSEKDSSAWLSKFCELNNIDLNSPNKPKDQEKLQRKLRKFLELAKRMDLHVAKSKYATKLDTVMDAVNYCENIKKINPNRILNSINRIYSHLVR